MNRRPVAAISWSGGKDSCAALMHACTAHDIVAMVTMFDEEAARSGSHGYVERSGCWALDFVLDDASNA